MVVMGCLLVEDREVPEAMADSTWVVEVVALVAKPHSTITGNMHQSTDLRIDWSLKLNFLASASHKGG